MTALRDIDRAKLACPLVHVLKDVTMQLAIPVDGQRNRRQALAEPLRRRQPLELLEIVGSPDIFFVDVDVCTRIAVWIVGHHSAACTFRSRCRRQNSTMRLRLSSWGRRSTSNCRNRASSSSVKTRPSHSSEARALARFSLASVSSASVRRFMASSRDGFLTRKAVNCRPRARGVRAKLQPAPDPKGPRHGYRGY